MVVKHFAIASICFLICTTHIVYGQSPFRDEKSSYGHNEKNNPLTIALKLRDIAIMGLQESEHLIRVLNRSSNNHCGSERIEKLTGTFMVNSQEMDDNGFKYEGGEGDGGGLGGTTP